MAHHCSQETATTQSTKGGTGTKASNNYKMREHVKVMYDVMQTKNWSIGDNTEQILQDIASRVSKKRQW